MSDDQIRREKLAALEAKLAAAKEPVETKHHSDEHYSKAHLAWRMVIELVVGILLGFGIGYGLDAYFGTIPLFLVLFLGLGLAAGVKTMMRSAEEIQRDKLAKEAGETEED